MIQYQKNKKANFNYEIIETLEAGLILQGWEAKAIQQKKLNMEFSFITIEQGVPKIHNVDITPPSETSTHVVAEPTATRKLLLHKKQISGLIGKIQREGYTLIPLSIYRHDKKGKIKCLIGLAKGKKQFDKREDLKKKAVQRDEQREAKGMKMY